MTDLYDAAVALVVAGFSVGLTMLWLRHLSRQHRQRMDQLLALREALHDDLLGSLVLHQETLGALGLNSLDWRGYWYGSPVFTRLGPKIPANVHGDDTAAGSDARLSDRVLRKSFQYDDISLEFRVGLKGLRGERHLFAVQAAEVLFAMIQGALAARQLALIAAMSQRAKVGVFLQHDMRNLAQWVQLVAEDFGSADNDELLMARARRLRSSSALAANRAQKMAQALLNTTWQPSMAAPLLSEEASSDHDLLNLETHVRDAGVMHQVSIDLHGAGSVLWDGSALATVLDNILSNVSGISRMRMVPAACRVVINSNAESVEVRFETPHLPLELPLDKLFEPWASTGDTNRGLGMYQARKHAEIAGGRLEAQTLKDGISVTLFIPRKNF